MLVWGSFCFDLKALQSVGFWAEDWESSLLVLSCSMLLAEEINLQPRPPNKTEHLIHWDARGPWWFSTGDLLSVIFCPMMLKVLVTVTDLLPEALDHSNVGVCKESL